MTYLLLGKVIKTHGLKGELKIFSHTDFANLRYQKGNVVYCLMDNEYKPLVVHSFFKMTPFDVVSFENYLDINLTNELINKEIFIEKERASLPNNYYHYIDLIDSNILSGNKIIGTVKEILEYPANRCLKCVSNDNKTFVIPFVDAFIKKIDVNNKTITVELIDGML